LKFEHLLTGLDTVECAYYLVPSHNCSIDFGSLSFEKEVLRHSKNRDPKVIMLGKEDFLLNPFGTKTGYPFIIENKDFSISFGEFNNPSFFVKFKCLSLWQYGIKQLHDKFLAWTDSVGLVPHHDESLSRVDFSFDYQINEIDFDENNFLSLSKKDSRYRKDRINQTFQFGKGDVVLRVYDKIAEIMESSDKHWFYELWGTDSNVWRIEWQIRKPVLKRFGIHTINDLIDQQGDLLRYLSNEHETLRTPTDDKNNSRWPLHPLWEHLQELIETIEHTGIYREIDQGTLLEEKKTRIAISVYGYLKRIAAIDCVKNNQPTINFDDGMKKLFNKLSRVHEPVSWQADIEQRIKQIRLG
jgi:hypothetical protein